MYVCMYVCRADQAVLNTNSKSYNFQENDQAIDSKKLM